MTDLDTFETALLAELRREVAEHPVAAPAPTPTRRPWRLRLAAVAATGVAASVGAIFGLGGTGGSPAYAVDRTGDGDVIVTVHRLDDATGLERALEAKGIDATVSYDADGFGGVMGFDEDGKPLPDEELPPPGNGPTDSGQVHNSDAGGATLEAGPGGEPPADDPCGLGKDPATLTQQGEDWVLRIPAGSPLQDRHVYLGTDAQGALLVTYAGDQPGSSCGMVTMTHGIPPA
jgi:hypothetical protein